MMTLRNIIKERHENFIGYQMREYYIHRDIPFYIVNDLDTNKVNVKKVISFLNNEIPKELFYGVDGVYVIDLPEFKEREINATYKDGTIYVTNIQDSTYDFLDDIVHELAHAIESTHHKDIYKDDAVEKEFITKRKMLYKILKNEGYVVDISSFLDINYNEEFDLYLYDDVGYNALDGLVQGCFLSPYSVTSIREYFATAFTDYLLYDKENIKKICPVVYSKIKKLFNEKIK